MRGKNLTFFKTFFLFLFDLQQNKQQQNFIEFCVKNPYKTH